MNDARISHETLHSLGAAYQAMASMPDFPALSRFEPSLGLCDRLAQTPGSVDPQEFAALEALDVALKSQLLDWLEGCRQPASVAR